MSTFNGQLSGQEAPEAVTITVTNSSGSTTTVMATTLTDGSFSATQMYAPGDYTAVASVAADDIYKAVSSPIVPFTVGLLDRTITLAVQ